MLKQNYPEAMELGSSEVSHVWARWGCRRMELIGVNCHVLGDWYDHRGPYDDVK